MAHDRKLLRALRKLEPAAWRGVVWRHMFASYPPERENTLGARWNPPGVAAIYASLERETALAEAEYQISMEPLRPPVRRTIYRIRVNLQSVLDLTTAERLASLGLQLSDLSGLGHAACQRIGGGAVESLAHDGLLVPSARAAGTNLVIYPARQGPEYEFRVVGHEVIFDPEAP